MIEGSVLHPNTDLPYTIALPTEYGTMLVNKYDTSDQLMPLLRAGRAVDHNEIRQMENFIEPGSTVVDAGTCFGAWTLAFARKAGAVHSFEPQRLIYQQLCGTLAINGIQNVWAHNTALGSQPGPIPVPKFDYNKPLQFSCVTFGEKKNPGMDQEPKESQEMVQRERLDTFGLKNVSLIKMDVEGMELDVLDGAYDTIRDSRPVLYIEIILTKKESVLAWFAEFSQDYSFWNNENNLLAVPSEKYRIETTENGGTRCVKRKP